MNYIELLNECEILLKEVLRPRFNYPGLFSMGLLTIALHWFTIVNNNIVEIFKNKSRVKA